MLGFTNLVVIVSFFVLTFGVALYLSKSKTTLDQYFIARNQFGWFTVGFVAFVANTSISTFINIGAWAYRDGLIAFNFELTGIICCILISLAFSKIYYDNKIFTTSEYVELRYNSQIAILTTILQLFMFIVTRISVLLITIALTLDYLLGIDIYTSSLIICIFCGTYSLVGGQHVNIKLGFWLGWIFLIGTGILVYFVYEEFQHVQQTHYPDNYFNLLRPMEFGSFSWPHIVFAMPIVGVWYHCVNLELVQKYLASKNVFHFQAGALLHGYLKLLVFPLVILPCMWASQICFLDNSESVISMLMYSVVPDYLLGIVIVGFIAVSMISISTSFNACSALFTFNLYKKKYPQANEFVLISIGKIALIVIVILSMVWVVLLQSFHDRIFEFVSSVLTYFTSPFAVIYLAGIFWKRANSKGAMYTMVSGVTIGFLKFLLNFIHTGIPFTNPTVRYIAEYNFFNFCIVLFIINTITIVGISLISTPDEKPGIEKLLYKIPDLKLLNAYERSFQKRIYGAALMLFFIINCIYLMYG
ncbi:MAG: hypothetical protein MUF42_07490 [Cytophagaceae bacterium]|jgi:SSS family solute:Na+ symporter|nr:hypothetical protein [Cytophagaceae bacterium]